MRIREREMQAVILLDAPARFEYFLKLVADRGELWVLCGWKGRTVAMATTCGRLVYPVWPAVEYAELLAKGHFASFTAYPSSLDTFLEFRIPALVDQNHLVGVFPTPRNRAVAIEPMELAEALKHEAEKYE